jgi:hypothetical protein
MSPDLFLWPQNWLTAGLMLNGKSQNYIELTNISPNQIALTNPPLEIDKQIIKRGTHYCVAAIVINNPSVDLSDDNPLPAQFFSSPANLAAYINTHPNIAWLNTREVDVTAPTWQTVTPITGPAEGGAINIGIQCKNIPTDAVISFSVTGPDAANTIIYKPTRVTNSNTAFSVPVTWPANYQSSITLNYTKGKKKPLEGATITPIANVSASDVKKALNNQNIPSEKIKQILQNAKTMNIYDSPKMTRIKPTKVIILGGMNHVFK